MVGLGVLGFSLKPLSRIQSLSPDTVNRFDYHN